MTDWIPPCAPWGRRSPRFCKRRPGTRCGGPGGTERPMSSRSKRGRRRNRGRFSLLFKLLAGAALVAALTFGATVFFQVEHSPDRWATSRYTAQEVGRGVRHPAGRQPVPGEQGADLRGHPAKAALCGGADHCPAPAQHDCHRDPGVGRGGQHPALQRDFNGGGTSGGGGRGH